MRWSLPLPRSPPAQRSIEVEVAYLEFGVDVEAEAPPNDVVEEDP